ncbi:hypothetical protein [Ruegeria sp. HKCCD8929]|nr:hypothetical protein [Ruegeria sp. HKCCD8929]
MKLIASIHVKPYVKRQKNDAVDAGAIAEAPRDRRRLKKTSP